MRRLYYVTDSQVDKQLRAELARQGYRWCSGQSLNELTYFDGGYVEVYFLDDDEMEVSRGAFISIGELILDYGRDDDDWIITDALEFLNPVISMNADSMLEFLG